MTRQELKEKIWNNEDINIHGKIASMEIINELYDYIDELETVIEENDYCLDEPTYEDYLMAKGDDDRDADKNGDYDDN